jgi:hypothetical protein
MVLTSEWRVHKAVSFITYNAGYSQYSYGWLGNRKKDARGMEGDRHNTENDTQIVFRHTKNARSYLERGVGWYRERASMVN